jgi:hypothetical protein
MVAEHSEGSRTFDVGPLQSALHMAYFQRNRSPQSSPWQTQPRVLEPRQAPQQQRQASQQLRAAAPQARMPAQTPSNWAAAVKSSSSSAPASSQKSTNPRKLDEETKDCDVDCVCDDADLDDDDDDDDLTGDDGPNIATIQMTAQSKLSGKQKSAGPSNKDDKSKTASGKQVSKKDARQTDMRTFLSGGGTSVSAHNAPPEVVDEHHTVLFPSSLRFPFLLPFTFLVSFLPLLLSFPPIASRWIQVQLLRSHVSGTFDPSQVMPMPQEVQPILSSTSSTFLTLSLSFLPWNEAKPSQP